MSSRRLRGGAPEARSGGLTPDNQERGTAQPSLAARPEPREAGKFIGLLDLRSATLVGAIVLLFAVLAVLRPDFFAAANLVNLVVKIAPLVVAVVGMTGVILCRHIDISIGAIFSWCGLVGALLAAQGLPAPLAVVAAVTLGAALGGINALLVAGLRLPSIVATLATMVVLDESLRWWRAGAAVRNLPEQVQWLGLGQDAGRLAIVLVAAAVLTVGWIVYHRLAVGRAVYAVGCDAEAARLVGLSPRRIEAGVFIAMGALAGLAAMLTALQFRTVQANEGRGLELAVIAAAVVGGVSINGGRGAVLGAAAGTILLATLGPALVWLRLDAYWARALQGLVILVAVAGDRAGDSLGAKNRGGRSG